MEKLHKTKLGHTTVWDRFLNSYGCLQMKTHGSVLLPLVSVKKTASVLKHRKAQSMYLDSLMNTLAIVETVVAFQWNVRFLGASIYCFLSLVFK